MCFVGKGIYSYVDQFRQNDADYLTVLLPVTSSGSPDYKWMDDYIETLIELTNKRLDLFLKIIEL